MNKISLIIPVYNEAEHLEKFLIGIDGLQLPAEKELVLVNDCSKDGSGKILDAFNFKSNAVIIHQERNQGKGAALRLGIARATGDFIGIQDADFEYRIEDIPMLIAPLLEGRADIVFGSRFKSGNPQVHRTFHYLVNRILTTLSNLFSGLYLTDMETCYKFFRSDIIKNIRLTSDRFGFEPEVTAKVARLKVRVEEFPISYFPRNYLEGKKITWKDGVAALRHIFFYNVLSKEKENYLQTLPAKYRPKGTQWL